MTGFDLGEALFAQGKLIKAIVRELRLSRRTVRKAIRCEETEFSYERSSKPQPKIGPWRAELDRVLAANTARPSRERLAVYIMRACIRADARGRFSQSDTPVLATVSKR